MEETRVCPRSKKEIAPKITHTKITISKSTPFLISKHHLDDTQMRNVMNYDDRTVKNNHQRTYSYKGEVISCVNSKIKQRFQTFQSPSNPIPPPPEKEKREEYYPQMQNKLVQVQSRVLKSRVQSNEHPSSKINGNKNTEVKFKKQTANNNNNDYGMQEQQLIEARKNLQKQTQRLKKIYKKNVEYDLKSTQVNKISDMQEQIRHLKVKFLQLEKQKLLKQVINDSVQKHEDLTTMNYKHKKETVVSLLRKPRFRIKHEQNNDTDSSFSSFQLQ